MCTASQHDESPLPQTEARILALAPTLRYGRKADVRAAGLTAEEASRSVPLRTTERRVAMKFVQTIARETSPAGEMKTGGGRLQAQHPDMGAGVIGVEMLKDRDRGN